MTGPRIAFFPEASFGAALNSVAIAQILRGQGCDCVFICHPGFTGVFSSFGFREVHLPDPGRTAASGDYWADFIRRHLPDFDLSPTEQLPTYVAATWEAIVDTVEDAEDGLEEALRLLAPDLIVLDNVVMFPAIARHGCPWVRVVSCAETEIPDARIPPYLSGLGPGDAAAKAAFEAAYLDAVAPPHARYQAFRGSRGLDPLAPGQFLEPSPDLTLIMAPALVRHDRAEPLDPARFAFVEGIVREEPPYALPTLPRNGGPLVYTSFGSLGALDTALIERLIAAFGRIDARFLVSVGAGFETYRNVPDNVHLAQWYPQPPVIARADLVIHHGGNNTFCEALSMGVPSLVMPYCWDGHDNARRAADTGTGYHLHRSDWTERELAGAIIGALEDTAMRVRLARASAEAPEGAKAAARLILDCARARSREPLAAG